MARTAGEVLVVDDDVDVCAAVRDLLGDSGYVVHVAGTGCDALEMLTELQPDVILLDLGLPDTSGLDLLTDMTHSSTAPVIVLSGRSGETDRVVGLDLGADDYISKPFGGRELVARVNAAMRRRRSAEPAHLMEFGDLAIDEATHDATIRSRQVALTPKEFDLLVFLAHSPRRVYTRSQLLRHVWGSSDRWQDDNTVAEHIYRIRRKLDPDDRERWIETVRGVGYRFAPAGEASS